ncbi:MAG: glutamine amidotransferase [Chlamydiales bacterium]|jgi:glutamine amidotransferase
MCRFSALLSKSPVPLQILLNDPTNSLVSQSYCAQESTSGINADGFGLGWYNHELSPNPGVFKSILPAWNDENLLSLTSKISSHCFIGHVRASTVGNVNYANCHPYSHNHFLFAHNGTIENFDAIKRPLIQMLPDELLKNIKGQTDSEYFFALICKFLAKDSSLKEAKEAINQAIGTVNSLQRENKIEVCSLLNLVFTNGHYLIATKYSSKIDDKDLSLYYRENICQSNNANAELCSITVSSEMLDDDGPENWIEVPSNHMIWADNTMLVHSEEITKG